MQKERVKKYLRTHAGIRLLSKNNLNDYGLWEIRGEDPNCDLGSCHSSPYIATVSGTLEQAIEYGVEQPRFWQWGAGGEFKKIKVIELEEL